MTAYTVKLVESDSDIDETVAQMFDMYRQFYGRSSDLAGAKAYLLERFRHGESKILVAYHHSCTCRPVGFAQLYPTFSSIGMKRSLILNDVFVCCEERKRGVGALLVRCAKRLGQEMDCRSIVLETQKENSSAKRLYLNEGFQLEADFETYCYSYEHE